MNERYQKDTAPSGKTRRSAASAKPKRTTEGDAPAQKSTSSAKGKGSSARPSFSIHPPTDEYRKIRRVWWVFMGAAVVLSTVSWWLWRQPMDRNYGTAVLVLAYASIGVAIWLDWTKMRPLRQEWAKEQARGKKS
jgi:hypothetical protein